MNGPIKPQHIVWWFLWGAFQVGIVVIYFLLARKPEPSTLQAASPIWMAALVPPLVGMALRWLVIPRMQNSVQALPVFVVGLALAEVATFLGIFLFPWRQQELFFASFLTISQFAPVFVGRLIANDPPSDAK